VTSFTTFHSAKRRAPGEVRRDAPKMRRIRDVDNFNRLVLDHICAARFKKHPGSWSLMRKMYSTFLSVVSR
jgi:hypothetical protein